MPGIPGIESGFFFGGGFCCCPERLDAAVHANTMTSNALARRITVESP
jgi:hypothetical protein